MVTDDGKLHNLSRGDHLIIFNEDKSVFWKGDIVYDWKTGYQPYPMNPKLGQQVAHGMWIHGVQKGFQPDAWATLFLNARRCMLTKKSDAPYWAGYTQEEMYP